MSKSVDVPAIVYHTLSVKLNKRAEEIVPAPSVASILPVFAALLAHRATCIVWMDTDEHFGSREAFRNRYTSERW